MSSCQRLRARWVIPVEGTPIEGGVVEIAEGRIAGVGVGGRGRAEDFGDAVIVPGLVNAHTHLELSGYANRIPAPRAEGDPVLQWLGELVRLRRSGAGPKPDAESVRLGAELSLRAGVTTVGDISRTNLAWPALKGQAIRKVCFAELISMAEAPPRTPEELRAEIDRVETDDLLAVGLGPHTPFTVSGEHLRECFRMAGERRLPITLHLAESASEVEWLSGRRNAISGFLDARRAIGDASAVEIVSPGLSPIEYLRQIGGFGVRTLLAHVNYVSDSDLDLLAGSGCSVAYCPRTHAYFCHPAHRFVEMLGRGINVCVATDSLASAPSLSVLDELRFVHRRRPDVPAATLLEMGTLRGATALSLSDTVGSLRPGKWADLIVVPLMNPGCRDPIEDLLDSEVQPTAVYVAGRRVGGS